jgi:hypothetical protein
MESTSFILSCAVVAVAAAAGVAFVWSRARSTVPTSPHWNAAAPRAETQWQRLSAVVELSLTRAADMSAHQAAAARQLEAAEYALHSLLGELQGVMTTSVVSPLAARVKPQAPTLAAHAALAA